uniref:RXLR5 n=1 Tax=Albugo laibachii Nc14 TaxID=890382 RepID=F0WN83_9STRA|nr:RXLR5 [Albugo laibachii Nc14]|eukprot:CCA22772.1 RXLR5 [Albugo laibachii Nc14]
MKLAWRCFAFASAVCAVDAEEAPTRSLRSQEPSFKKASLALAFEEKASYAVGSDADAPTANSASSGAPLEDIWPVSSDSSNFYSDEIWANSETSSSSSSKDSDSDSILPTNQILVDNSGSLDAFLEDASEQSSSYPRDVGSDWEGSS